MTTEELEKGLYQLKERAELALALAREREAGAKAQDRAALEGAGSSGTPIRAPFASREACLNLGRMIARSEACFNKAIDVAEGRLY